MVIRKKGTGEKSEYSAAAGLLYRGMIAAAIIAVFVLILMIVKDRISLNNKKSPVKNIEELYHEGELILIDRKDDRDASYDAGFAYDFDGDGIQEQVKITWDMSGRLVFDAEGFDRAEFDADIVDEDRYVISAAVIDNSLVGDGSGKEVLVLSRASYPTENEVGSVKISIWLTGNDGFRQLMDVSYSGLSDEVGIMREGAVKKNMEGDTFFYDVLVNQNEYIYERSRIIADLRELGIKLPYETCGAYFIDYKRWADEACHFIVK